MRVSNIRLQDYLVDDGMLILSVNKERAKLSIQEATKLAKAIQEMVDDAVDTVCDRG